MQVIFIIKELKILAYNKKQILETKITFGVKELLLRYFISK